MGEDHMYGEGRGVHPNQAEAAKWYRRAANHGDAGAQGALGGRYEKGQGVPQDDAETVKWYRKSAEQGYALAQFQLGLFYGLGEVVPQDYVLSYMWLNLAVAMGAKRASEFRDLTAKQMTQADVSEAQRLAREWMAAFEKRKKK